MILKIRLVLLAKLFTFFKKIILELESNSWQVKPVCVGRGWGWGETALTFVVVMSGASDIYLRTSQSPFFIITTLHHAKKKNAKPRAKMRNDAGS